MQIWFWLEVFFLYQAGGNLGTAQLANESRTPFHQNIMNMFISGIFILYMSLFITDRHFFYTHTS